MLSNLLNSRTFWLAVVALVWNVIFYIWPQFPADVRDAVNNILIVVISVLAVENAARSIASARAPHAVASTLVVPERLDWLLKSRRFWIAVLAAAQTILFSSLPDFPAEIWASINTVAIVAIIALTVDDSAAHLARAYKRSLATSK